jgi:glycine hydroxymethyltransferase
LPRAKVDFDVLQTASKRARQLSASLGIDTAAQAEGYPHFYAGDASDGAAQQVRVEGAVAGDFLQIAATSDVAALNDGESQPTHLLEKDGSVMASGEVKRVSSSEYRLRIAGQCNRAIAWLRALSDGFVLFDDDDLHAKLPGPVVISALGETAPFNMADPAAGFDRKAYHIGINGASSPAPNLPETSERGSKPKESPSAAAAGKSPAIATGLRGHRNVGEELEEDWSPLPRFVPEIAMVDMLRETPLHSLHLELGAKMAPFAGYDMPLWYKSVSEEHAAVRDDAGVFDVAHMGVFDLRGRGAEAFLDQVTTNDVRRLKVGASHYSYLLDVDGIPLDDLMIYRLAEEHFLAVVNASNNDKIWAWLNAVIAGEVMIAPEQPARRIEGTDRFEPRDLRLRQSGADRRVDIALQGPKSLDYLLQLGGSNADHTAVRQLKWAGVVNVTLGDIDLIVSRTGYTGERIAYELFVHPERAAELFRRLVDLGVTPCGLAARDSLRTEAGLPLYGFELAGDLNLNPAEAGFGAYVKLYKPFFVGKRALVKQEAQRKTQVSRFRLDVKRADGSVSARPRPAHYGDPIVNARGRVVGIVTSCNIDSDGFQLGQALLERGFRKPGTQLVVFASAGRAKPVDIGSLSLGKRVTLPQPLTILSRFPRRK